MKQQVSDSQILSPPIFNQSEINQMTTSAGIKIDYFKRLIKQKTPAELNHFYVNHQNSA